MRRQDGQALVLVLVVMFILQIAAWAFLSRMNVEQRFAGGSTRSLAAFYLAEAGLQKVLWGLEQWPPEVPTNGEPLPHQEALGSGMFAVEALEHLPGGLISIVVRGEAAGTVRRLKALVRAGPEALAYGLYGQHTVAFDGQVRVYLLPSQARGSGRRLGHLAAGGEVRFDSRWATLNAFRGLRLSLRDRTFPDSSLLGSSADTDPDSGLVDIVLAGEAQLRSGTPHEPVTLEDLRRQIGGVGVRRVRTRTALPVPLIDAANYRAWAEANTANAAINAAAGVAGAESGFRPKAHSRYSEDEFEAILDFLRDRPKRPLHGIVFVEGDVILDEREGLTIIDGALVVNGNIEIGPGARLEVRHSDTTRALPGIIAWGEGTLQIRKEAVATIDGLILAGKDVQIDAGVLDVMGAVVTGNFLSQDGIAVIRYNSAVLATVGLRRVGKGVAELLSWQELP